MDEKKSVSCSYCFEGKCYMNAAVSPEEFDAHVPYCTECQSETPLAGPFAKP